MLLPKPELRKGAKHLPGKTDVRGKLPQTPRNQLGLRVGLVAGVGGGASVVLITQHSRGFSGAQFARQSG